MNRILRVFCSASPGLVGDRRSAGAGGFTLVEILVTLTVLGLVTGGLLRVFVSLLTIFHYDGAKLLVNRDFRRLTDEFAAEVRFASQIRIQAEVSALDRAADAAVEDPPLDAAGQAGNCLVLVFTDPVEPGNVRRIVVYYLRSSAGPLRRVERTFAPASASAVGLLIPVVTSTDDGARTIVTEITGKGADGRLFGWVSPRSVSVYGQLSHRGGRLGTVQAVAENTYWTIFSARG